MFSQIDHLDIVTCGIVSGRFRLTTNGTIGQSSRTARAIRVAAVMLLSLLSFLSIGAHSRATALVAVATNFSETAEQLKVDFEDQSEYRITLTTGSTGKFFAQILNGAPFDVLLAADAERPALLEQEGLSVPGSRFTYAVGRLVLWSRDPTLIGSDGSITLRAGNFRKLAIANPLLAPYGAAAVESLQALDLYEQLGGRIVMGENVGQTHTMVSTGNADLGLVAYSYLAGNVKQTGGSRWEVPDNLHSPIAQDAVLLVHGAENAAARAFLAFLAQPEAQRVTEGFGYGTR